MYYNQNHYAKTPYPAPGYESATVKSSGCGPVSMAMALEDLTGQPHPPPKVAAYAIKVGARVSGGTNMAKLCRAVAQEYGLAYSTSINAADALNALYRGARVIANVGGDRPGYTGLFSDGGHYIYLRSAAATRVTVWDPGYYDGKYNKPRRKGRVTVRGNDIYATMGQIAEDCSNRNPRYYILDPKKEETAVPVYETLNDVPTSYRPTIQKLMERKALVGHKDPDPSRLDDNILHIDETYCRVMTTLDKLGKLD